MFNVETQFAEFDHDRKKWGSAALSTGRGAPRPAAPRAPPARRAPAGQPVLFQSIPDGMWWALVTLCTVGYGDLYPVTGLGKFVASLAMIAGILIIAYPITMLTKSFSESWDEYLSLESRRKRHSNLHRRLGKRPSGARASGDEDPEGGMAAG
eukprot:gene6114-10698_t